MLENEVITARFGSLGDQQSSAKKSNPLLGYENYSSASIIEKKGTASLTLICKVAAMWFLSAFPEFTGSMNCFLQIAFYSRNIERLPCFHRVVITRLEVYVWKNKTESCGNTNRRRESVSTAVWSSREQVASPSLRIPHWKRWKVCHFEFFNEINFLNNFLFPNSYLSVAFNQSQSA